MNSQMLFTERLFLRSPNINVAMYLSLKRTISKEDVYKALDKLVQKHPFLISNIQIEKDQKAFYFLSDPDSSEERKKLLKEIPEFLSFKTEDIFSWYRACDEKISLPEKGPLFKVGVSSSAEKCEIIFLAHHLLGDGMAHLTIVKDFLFFLENPQSETEPLLPLLIGSGSKLPSRSRLGLVSSLFSRKLNRDWRKTGRSFSDDEYRQFREKFRIQNPAGIIIDSPDESLTDSIVKRCRKVKVSVNDLLICCLVRALQKNGICTGSSVRTGVAVSVRNDVKPAATGTLGNFVSGVLVNKGYNEEIGFVENLKEFSRVIGKRVKRDKVRFALLGFSQNLDPEFIDSLFFAEYGDYNNPVSRKLAHTLGENRTEKGPGISNLGRIALSEEERKLVENIIFIPPSFPANLITFGILTCDRKINFCFRFFENLISEKEVQSVSGDLKQYLKEFAVGR